MLAKRVHHINPNYRLSNGMNQKSATPVTTSDDEAGWLKGAVHKAMINRGEEIMTVIYSSGLAVEYGQVLKLIHTSLPSA